MSEPAPAPPRSRRLAEVITVGLPFSTFKLIVGLHLVRTTPLGWPLVILGAVDLAMNVTNAVGLVVVGRPFGPLCLLHGVVRKLRGPNAAFEELGLAIDTALAFVLVAGMIGAGQLGQLPSATLSIWNIAVILNILGAGLLRLADAIERASRSTRGDRTAARAP